MCDISIHLHLGDEESTYNHHKRGRNDRDVII